MAGRNDPGVKSVTAIFNHYKRQGVRTELMGARFRNIGQIAALDPAMDPGAARAMTLTGVHYDTNGVREAPDEDAMASDKLADGMRLFAADSVKLEALIQRRSG